MSERFNMENHRKKKVRNMHSLVDCFHEEMSDAEIAQELDITLEEVHLLREKYET